jgi:hypothetical protein
MRNALVRSPAPEKENKVWPKIQNIYMNNLRFKNNQSNRLLRKLSLKPEPF